MPQDKPSTMSGYTDEAVEEGHDLMYRAEEEAHMHDDEKEPSSSSKMKKGSGLESSIPSDMKDKMGKKMSDMKDSMGMDK